MTNFSGFFGWSSSSDLLDKIHQDSWTITTTGGGMSEYQRMQAIETIANETEVAVSEIEKYQDYALDAWANELGYEWDGSSYVYMDDEI